MPTKITSERARELGRRGAAAVEREPGTGKFRRREPDAPPADLPADPPAPPPADPPAPSFRLARSLFGRRKRA